MDYRKFFGYGILLWGITYIIERLFLGYNYADATLARIIMLIAFPLLTFAFSRNLYAEESGDVLKYTIGWVVIAFVLNLLFLTPVTGSGFLVRWEFIVGYVSAIFAPLLRMPRHRIAMAKGEEERK